MFNVEYVTRNMGALVGNHVSLFPCTLLTYRCSESGYLTMYESLPSKEIPK